MSHQVILPELGRTVWGELVKEKEGLCKSWRDNAHHLAQRDRRKKARERNGHFFMVPVQQLCG